MYKAFFIFLTLSALMTSCQEPDVIVMGMSPVYESFDDFSRIQSESPRPFGLLGKIVTVGDYLFINEVNRGIHVIDNENPSNPVNILFWNIPGNTTFTIEDNTLYADNTRHLIVIDISDFTNIEYIQHVADFYEGNEAIIRRPPEDYFGPFECVNTKEGILVDWVLEELTNPLCDAF